MPVWEKVNFKHLLGEIFVIFKINQGRGDVLTYKTYLFFYDSYPGKAHPVTFSEAHLVSSLRLLCILKQKIHHVSYPSFAHRW